MDLLKQLNPEQKQAVTHKDGPLLIVAGAGTGKTTVITQKIAWLILEKLAKPDEILAVTFTEKAAQEMEERVDQLLPYGYVDLWISTFHSFAQRVLEADGLDIGLPNDFKLLDQTQAWLLVRQNLDKFNLDYYKPLGNPTKFIHALLKHFSRCKDELVAPEDYLKYAEDLKLDNDAFDLGVVQSNNKKKVETQHGASLQDDEIKAQEIKRLNEVAEAYHVYQKLLLDNNALDFGDLINYCLKLFQERPKILNKYRQKFKYLLIDEFQDTNYAQYQLIKLLAAPENNLTVVADDDQSIYKFRGASVSNILEFKKDYPDSTDVFLTTNYRSQQNILDLSYNFIQLNNPDRLEQQYKDKGQKLSKKLKSHKKGQAVIEHLASETLDDEVSLVAEKIFQLKEADKDFSWNDIGILVRANDSAKPFTEGLNRAGIATQFLASSGLYNKPIILDIIAYLKLLDDYHESPALYRVLNLPVINIPLKDLIKLNYFAKRKSWSLYETLKQAPTISSIKQGTLQAINKVLGFIESHTQLAKAKSVGQVILAFLEDTGYLKHLTKEESLVSQQNASYLNQFYKKVKDFEAASADTSVKTFLELIDYELESGEEGSLSQELDQGPEAVKALTVHSAKGLEFKHVFIVNLVDRRFPTTERKDPIELPDALVKEILPSGNAYLQEERRLFYVAMTRAMQGLYFTSAQNYGGVQKKKPSKFLTELDIVSEPQTVKGSDIGYPGQVAVEAKDQINYQDLLPKKFSFSQIKAFETCPYQYRFAHILKIPIHGKWSLSYGKTIHDTLHKYFLAYLRGQEKAQGDLFGSKKSQANPTKPKLDDLLKLYEESWIDDWYQDKNQKDKYFQQGKNQLKEFYQGLGDKWPPVAHLERAFNLKLKSDQGEITFKGVIDRQDKIENQEQGPTQGRTPTQRRRTGNQEYEIIDYKTGKDKSDKISAEDKKQLLIYQIAAQEVFGEEVATLTYHYIDGNSKVSFLGTDKELEKQKDKMVKTVQEIKKAKFPPKSGFACKTCDFQGICEYRKL